MQPVKPSEVPTMEDTLMKASCPPRYKLLRAFKPVKGGGEDPDTGLLSSTERVPLAPFLDIVTTWKVSNCRGLVLLMTVSPEPRLNPNWTRLSTSVKKK